LQQFARHSHAERKSIGEVKLGDHRLVPCFHRCHFRLMARLLLGKQRHYEITYRIQPALVKGRLNRRAKDSWLVEHRRLNAPEMINLS
jgi:hypothetical protein